MVVSKDSLTYCAGWPDDQLTSHLIMEVLEDAGLKIEETGEDLRIRDRGNLRTIVNYGPKSQDASHLIGKSDEILVGSDGLPVAGVTILRRAGN